MKPEEILNLFRQSASELSIQPTYTDTIKKLAHLLADSRDRLSTEYFDTLIHIGAILYKAELGKSDARTDVAEIMRQSVENENGSKLS